MRRAFVLRVQNDDPGIARAIARALVGPLAERGVRVRVDGVLQNAVETTRPAGRVGIDGVPQNAVETTRPAGRVGIDGVRQNAVETTRPAGRVGIEGTPQGTRSQGVVHLMTAPRGVKGTSVVVGVADEEQNARWLAPIEVPDDAEPATTQTLAFLETWGFVGAKKGVSPANSSTSRSSGP